MSRRKESQGTYQEGLVFSQDELPPGYEPIGPLNDSNKPLHSFINRECRANRVRRYRIKNGTTGYGRLFVHKDDIARLTKEWNEPEDRDSTEEPATNLQYHSVCESLADIAQSLAAVERLLGRLADAAESIATQPKTPQRELLHTINGNPAPWNET
jgi:hypothetical protein